MMVRILISALTLLAIGLASLAEARDLGTKSTTSSTYGTRSTVTTDAARESSAIAPSASSETHSEPGADEGLEVSTIDPDWDFSSDVVYDSEAVTEELVADVLSNPAYSETTKDILIEQIESGELPGEAP